MSSQPNVTDGHDDAMQNCRQLFGQYATPSYQGLMNILLVHTPQLMKLLQAHLREKMAHPTKAYFF
jgi:hypothetical protein